MNKAYNVSNYIKNSRIKLLEMQKGRNSKGKSRNQ